MTTHRFSLFSGNALKIFAAVTMLIDHIGVILFPRITLFRIIGRIAMPIFAFMIAEGCRYTKNKLRYLLGMFSLGAVCQLVYFIYDRSLYMCILITFSLSVIMIYALQFFYDALFSKKAPMYIKILSALLFMITVGITFILNRRLTIDYDFFGCLLPVFPALVHFPDTAPTFLKRIDRLPIRVLMLAIGLMLLSANYNMIQYYSLLSLPLLLMYSGKRGKLRMKYFFYIFYPTHLLILEGIAMLVR